MGGVSKGEASRITGLDWTWQAGIPSRQDGRYWIHGGGFIVTNAFAPLGRLIQKLNTAPHNGAAISGYAYLYDTHAYTYDPAGNPVSRTENGRQSTYTYNALNQHPGAENPTETDVAGRLTRPAGVPVAVTVNGLPTRVELIAAGDQTDTLAWRSLAHPLALGDNPFRIQATSATGLLAAQTNVVTGHSPVFEGQSA
jgi:hypothetical protein